ncbi:TRAP transporter small permease subunit [Falsiroseomonas stagni]|uniref:TRAP transporter small permease protein n=1 Tax=Falsiroseomonas stagni DSM 19981 TaxID=1123062 RepID=A0A1I3YIC9_9PROT|nr:TRAP transporter small permease [Falsiroseomonas stagni]SFK31099.1 TRAP-type mannitol/chloroaromatic compound transport system, small permease component [Falsiroseomonas stagni DSM 19981]
MKPVTARLLIAIDMACALGAAAAAVSALALAALLIAEVIVTSFFAWSQPWAVEYSIYLQAVVMFGGAGWALRNGGHIRVQMGLSAMSPLALRVVDASVSAFSLGIVGFIAWALTSQAWRTFDLGSVSYYPMQTPVWIPQAALALAFILFALALVARLIRLGLGEDAEIPNTVGGTIE